MNKRYDSKQQNAALDSTPHKVYDAGLKNYANLHRFMKRLYPMIFPLFPMLCSTILLFQFYHETLRRAMCNRKNGKSGNLITLIKLPGLPQYYVNRFTPPP